MKQYFRILMIILRNALIRDAEIPGYILANLLSQIVEILITIVFFDIIFAASSTLAGWTFYQVLFLYAFSKIITISNSIIFRSGVNAIGTDMIRLGNLDFYITKPVDSMILASINKPRVYQTIALLFYLGLAFYSIHAGNLPVGVVNLVWFLILAVCGFILFYFLHVLTIIPVFWLIRLHSLPDIITRINQFTRYPAGVFPYIIKVALFVVFPVLTAMYLPVRILFFPVIGWQVAFMFLITIIFTWLTRILWGLGLKRYASASS